MTINSGKWSKNAMQGSCNPKVIDSLRTGGEKLFSLNQARHAPGAVPSNKLWIWKETTISSEPVPKINRKIFFTHRQRYDQTGGNILHPLHRRWTEMFDWTLFLNIIIAFFTAFVSLGLLMFLRAPTAVGDVRRGVGATAASSRKNGLSSSHHGCWMRYHKKNP